VGLVRFLNIKNLTGDIAMKYNNTRSIALPDKDDKDLGIDLVASETVSIPPLEYKIVETHTHIEFPLFGRVRQFITRVIFGNPVTGIGALVWPRSRHDYVVLAGVVDPSYRGPIKVKIFNTDKNKDLVVYSNTKIAQLVPVVSFSVSLEQVDAIDKNTNRGERGGINLVRGDRNG
jgi:dUTP pyrophosphatase